MNGRRPIRTVTAVLGERAALFELGILSQVFGLDRSGDGLPGYDFQVAALATGTVPTTCGLRVTATHDLTALADTDLVAVPAWPAVDGPVDPRIVEAILAATERGAALLSICSGTFLLAAAGVLDGRRATTHWQFADRLARRYPRVNVRPDVLYVEDGPVVTGAGAAAGVDAALHVVRREHGAAVATALARRMVVAAHRSGGQAQFIETPVPAVADDGTDLAALADWAVAHLDTPLTVADLAARVAMSPRSFARRFVAAVGLPPKQWLLEQRLRHAEQLLEETTLGVEAIAHRCGFGSGDTLRHHFARRRGTSPTAHRAAFAD